ncbi:MAG: sensory transduction histidine kinase, partial [Nitrosomonas europaea]
MKKSGFSHPLGLRQRLLLWILLPLIAVFIGSILFDYRLAQETADTAYDHSLNISRNIQCGVIQG